MENELPQNDFIVGLRVAIKILKHWSNDQKQHLAILDIPLKCYSSVQINDNSYQFELNQNQETRICIILNIHAVLKTLFRNKNNIYGFMSMVNNNVYFEGETPLAKISTGKMKDLQDTYNHIQNILI
jgi:hypothetical protein